MPILEIFRIDKKYWGESQLEKVKEFYGGNPFFSKHLSHFQELLSITMYAQVHPHNCLKLQQNKQAETVMLLRGCISLSKKERVVKKRKVEHSIVTTVFECKDHAVTIPLNGEVWLACTQPADILYVPSVLYNKFVEKIQAELAQRMLGELKKVYLQVSKSALLALACNGCSFAEYRIFYDIYKQGSQPQFVYVLTEGNVKIAGNLVSAHCVFGERDIHLQQRITSATCLSSHAKVLLIPKKTYLQFSLSYLEQKLPLQVHSARKSLPVLESKNEELIRLPKVFNLPGDSAVELKLLRNCHLLTNIRRRGRQNFRSPESPERDYSVDQYEEKCKFIEKRRPFPIKLDIEHKLF